MVDYKRLRGLAFRAKARAEDLDEQIGAEPQPRRREELEAERQRQKAAFRDLWRHAERLKNLAAKLEPLREMRDGIRQAVRELRAELGDADLGAFDREEIEFAVEFAERGRRAGHRSDSPVPDRLVLHLPRGVHNDYRFLPLSHLNDVIAERQRQWDEAVAKAQASVEAYEQTEAEAEVAVA